MQVKNDFPLYVENLATISPAMIELINIIDEPETTGDEVAKLVSTDKVLLLNIFKYLSSAAFAMRRKPNSIEEAIQYLGLQELKNIIFTIAAGGHCSDKGIWYKSIFVAFSAKRIAEQSSLDPKQVSNIYIAALMHNIGSMVFKDYDAEHYNQFEILDLKERIEAEEKEFGINHIQLSYEMARKNQLPEEICKLIQRQDKDWQGNKFCFKNAIIEIARSLSEIDLVDAREIDAALNKNMLKRFGLNKIRINVKLVNEFHNLTEDFLRI